jgi:hypothetical protein
MMRNPLARSFISSIEPPPSSPLQNRIKLRYDSKATPVSFIRA